MIESHLHGCPPLVCDVRMKYYFSSTTFVVCSALLVRGEGPLESGSEHVLYLFFTSNLRSN